MMVYVLIYAIIIIIIEDQREQLKGAFIVKDDNSFLNKFLS